jgi:hypothetical protein
MPYRRVGLRFTRHGYRRAHFHSHRLCQFLKSGFANCSDALQQGEALTLSPTGKMIKGGDGSGDGSVNIRLVTQRNLTQLLNVDGVEHGHRI